MIIYRIVQCVIKNRIQETDAKYSWNSCIHLSPPYSPRSFPGVDPDFGNCPESEGLLSDLGTITNGDEIELSRPTLVLAVRLILIGSVYIYIIAN
nr:hypothetical protein [uncultured archaeon]